MSTKLTIETILNTNSVSKDSYCYIQSTTYTAIHLIDIAWKYALRHYNVQEPIPAAPGIQRQKYLRILDVGAGTGGTMLVIKGMLEARILKNRMINFNISGIEHDPNLLPIAEKQKVNVTLADALTFNQYKNYEIIYYYHPIKNSQLMRQLEQYIADNAKPGTLLVSALKCRAEDNTKDFVPTGVKTIFNNYMSAVYVKI